MRSIGKWIAITGGAAEGKTVVSRALTEQGFKCASADSVVSDLWDDPETVEELAIALGLEGDVTREMVRREAFAEPEVRRKLNDFFHGRVMDELIASEAEFVEIPLLIETCLHPLFDAVWVVCCGEDEQRRRLAARGLTEIQIDQLLASQLSAPVRKQFADRIIRTNESLESVHEQVLDAIECSG